MEVRGEGVGIDEIGRSARDLMVLKRVEELVSWWVIKVTTFRVRCSVECKRSGKE